MAITRAQQAKQMLREGGRIGLKGGADASEFGKSGSNVNVSSSGSVTKSKSVSPGGGNTRRGDDGPDRSKVTETQNINQLRNQNRFVSEYEDLFPGDKPDNRIDIQLTDREKTQNENKDIFTKTATGKDGNETFIDRLNNRNRKFFYDKVLKGNFQNYDLTELDNLYDKYMEGRTSGATDAYGRDIIPPGRDDPIMVGNMFNQNQDMGDNNTEDQEPEEPFVPNFRLLADGGMPEDAPVYEGGIMDLESARQMYGLGKLVKKITRSVKKVAKSPIGKAALLYFGGNALAGGGLKSFLLGSNAGPSFSKTGLLQKMFLKNPSLGFSLGNLSGTAMAGVPAALSYFMTPKEEDSDEELYLGPELDMEAIENKPMDFINYRNRADGGIMRAGYEEGGDAEPVAKKTMPLLDMDGMEKDYREDGGFVPIGRMEKADDVPARLSKNEFVFTADAVRNAGEGDIDKGAEVMYNMMKNLESGGEVSEESQGLEGAREMFQTSQRLEEVI